MTIEFRSGDLLDTTDPFIAHGCNAYGEMGAGVALQIAKRYPWVAEKFKRTYQYHVVFNMGPLPLGKLFEYGKRDASYHILNLTTQQGYGREKGKRYVSYDAVDEAFKAVKARIKDKPISIPRIGAGLGGGSWGIIEAIIEEHLRDNRVTVWDLP